MKVRFISGEPGVESPRPEWLNTDPHHVFAEMKRLLPPTDKTQTTISEQAAQTGGSVAQLRSIVADRESMFLVLSFLAEGRTDLADLWTRAEHTPFADLTRRIITLLDNPEDDPNHICCECSDQDPDWDECPNCMDRDHMDPQHCAVCRKVCDFTEELDEIAADPTLPKPLKERLEKSIEALAVLENDCNGAE